MNKKKAEYEKRKVLRLMQEVNRHRNCLRFYKNESDNHAKKKFLLFRELQKDGFEIYTEVKFKNGKRADLVAIDKLGKAYGFEILESETIKQCERKLKSYPKLIEWHIIGNFDDIKNW